MDITNPVGKSLNLHSSLSGVCLSGTVCVYLLLADFYVMLSIFV